MKPRMPSQPERKAMESRSVKIQTKNSARRAEKAEISAKRQPTFALPSERQAASRRVGRAGVLVGGDRAFRDAHLVDLVGPVGEAGPAGVLQHVRQRSVGGVAERTVYLHGAVDDP